MQNNYNYTPTLTNAVVSTGNINRSVNFRSQTAAAGQHQPPTSVAKHRLPMQINRQSPQVNRALLGQQHATLPVRNIAALARPLAQTLVAVAKPVPPQSAPSPTIAGRVLASPVKDTTLDDDLLEGVVEKRPKYHKHLPLNYQYVLQDHNYGAPPPPTPISPPKPLVNGVPMANGLTRSQLPVSQQPASTPIFTVGNRVSKSMMHTQQTTHAPTTFGTNTMSNVFGIGTRGPAPAEESDVESTDGEREVDPQGEETETAPEGEDNDEDSVTRCICDFLHDDGYMICCDKCLVWQHVDCMGIDRANIPEEYLCEKCQPRRIDKQKAIALQLRKKKEQRLADMSDSSSDSSSSSDAKVPVRRPNLPVNSRRRSEPAHRKNSVSHSGNAKQRRELNKEGPPAQSTARQNNRQSFRKKQAEKRPPVRRKKFFQSNPTAVNNIPSAPEKPPPMEKKVTSGSNPVEQLRQWIDSYEEAMENYYSRDLRIRLNNIKVNGIHSDLKLPTNQMTTPKCRVSLLPSGIKILVASGALSSNQPLVELRGRYSLASAGFKQSRNVPPSGPYIFYYKVVRENLEICVDARTFGNDARFVRRSCKPNCELRHYLDKAKLYLYLVATKAIEKNTEITLAPVPGLSCIQCGDSCASSALSPPDNRKMLNGLISPNSNTQISDKRRRGRRRTVSENLSPPKSVPKPLPPVKSLPPSKVLPSPKPTPKVVPSVRVPTPPPRVPTPPPPPEPVVKKAPTPPSPPTPPPPPAPLSPPPPAPTTRSAASNAARKTPPAPVKKEEKSEPSFSNTKQLKKEAADKKNKMTREERKMEAIMKAFERMEKDQARKQEAQAKQTQRKDSTETDSKSNTVDPKEKEKDKEKSSDDKEESPTNNRTSQRKRKFTVVKRKGRNRSQSTPQPVLRPRRMLRHSQPSRARSPDTGDSSDESPVRTNARTSTPPPPSQPSPPKTPVLPDTALSVLTDFSKAYESPPQNQVNTSSSSGETPPTPMSKTALLVAAAVGPLAPGFKFPKTKKGLMNSWLKSPEGSPPIIPDELSTRGQGLGIINTKKRWLRQAISEECDSPNSRQDVNNSPTEHAAPPKKRRMARESVSEDHTFTPPSTPTHATEALSQCGSSQDSEGPESPAEPTTLPKIEEEVKNEMDEEAEESEEEPNPLKQDTVKEEEKATNVDVNDNNNGIDFKEEVDLKEKETDMSADAETSDDKSGDQGSAAASATKRKLSISEYRQRKQQGTGSLGQGSTGKTDQPSSPHTSGSTSSLSSSDDEDETLTTPAVIAKSLLLEAALDTNLAKKPPGTHVFDSAPTLVERQRENLTQRLKREFGLFLSDDEEQEKARKQANIENKEKEKESCKKKNLPPPPPPTEPPTHYPLYFPGVGHPMYTNRYPPVAVPPPTPLVETPYYTAPPSYYSQLPH